MLFKKSAAEAEKEARAYEAKIREMKKSIENFQLCLNEDFILGTNIAETFKKCFKFQLDKKGFSATGRWCRDVIKKLEKLDEGNKKFFDEHKKSPTILRMARGDYHQKKEAVEIREEFLPLLPKEYKEVLKTKNIKEFKKIFGTTTAFDINFLGFETRVKATLSQKAAVNKVKKELNDLCDPENFKRKS